MADDLCTVSVVPVTEVSEDDTGLFDKSASCTYDVWAALLLDK